jgi:hypothetical protein
MEEGAAKRGSGQQSRRERDVERSAVVTRPCGAEVKD